MFVLMIFLFWIVVWPFCVCVCVGGGGGGGKGGGGGRREGKKLPFWLSAYSVLIVVPLLLVRPSVPLVSWTEGVK